MSGGLGTSNLLDGRAAPPKVYEMFLPAELVKLTKTFAQFSNKFHMGQKVHNLASIFDRCHF